uniref:Solute-binding protein family 3/N-terminal domain-containing protein n=1 Tax=Haptolina brevifila TaxID=156173 RepID=A0A7S2IDS5_9EUKA
MYDSSGTLLPSTQWTGYFPDLLQWIGRQSGMTYTLTAPSGAGSSCASGADNTGNYGCGQQDVTELGTSDIYVGLYYVTAQRLQAGLMSRTFTGDAGLAVAQKGGATDTLDSYQAKQAAGTVGRLCTLTGAAFTDWVSREYPAIDQVAVAYSEYVTSIRSGACDAFVVDRPIALQIAAQNCDLNLGVGPSTTYGYHDCAFGIRKELNDVTIAISYWIEWLRTCSPNDSNDFRCYNAFNLATLYVRWGIAPDQCPASSSPPPPPTAAGGDVTNVFGTIFGTTVTNRLDAIFGLAITTLVLVSIAFLVMMSSILKGLGGGQRAVGVDTKNMIEPSDARSL